MKLPDIAAKFDIPGGVWDIRDFGGGHIHQTFRVWNDSGNGFILQNLNTFVFRNPLQLMDNAIRITDHLNKKSQQEKIRWKILDFIPAKSGEYLFMDDKSGFWRMFRFIPNSTQPVNDSRMVVKAGEAYGDFIRMMSDLPGPDLYETIPGFHDLEFRLEQFNAAVRKGIKERIREADQEIQMVEKYKETMLLLPYMLKDGMLKKRITHNDTKFDNILFNEKYEVISVVDLDTVMPGLLHSDFGDAIRSFANTAPEDEPDESKIQFSLMVFENFARGFIGSLKDELTENEKGTLVLAPSMFAYMQGIRFLNDYLINDPYYRIKYEKHNLVRAKNQFTLFTRMKEKEKKMLEIIESFLEG